ncbi:hypothetical protein IAT38_002151 [Cryptococcus sp. DSM 104549]
MTTPQPERPASPEGREAKRRKTDSDDAHSSALGGREGTLPPSPPVTSVPQLAGAGAGVDGGGAEADAEGDIQMSNGDDHPAPPRSQDPPKLVSLLVLPSHGSDPAEEYDFGERYGEPVGMIGDGGENGEDEGGGGGEVEEPRAVSPAPEHPASETASAFVSSQPPQPEIDEPKPKPKSKKSSTPASTSAKALGSASGSGAGAKGGKKGAAGVSAAGGKKGKGKTKVEELKEAEGVSKPKQSSVNTSVPRLPRYHPPTSPTPHLTLTTSPSGAVVVDPNAVYCICQKPYNDEIDEGLMLGCDSCDNWYHVKCVGMPDEMVDLLDVYICRNCERTTSQRTVYKQVCKRDGCNKSVAGLNSKFCCSRCAFRYSQALLGAYTNKSTLKQLSKALSSFPPPQVGGVSVVHTSAVPGDAASGGVKEEKAGTAETADTLRNLERAIKSRETKIALAERRQLILQHAITRAERLPPLAPLPPGEAEALAPPPPTKGRKKKSGGGGGGGGKVDDRACGYDWAVLVEDEEVWGVDIGEGGEGAGDGEPEAGAEPGAEGGAIGRPVCMSGRRKCDRHQGWQRNIATQLDLELAVLGADGRTGAVKKRDYEILQAQQQRLEAAERVDAANRQARDAFLAKKEAFKRK